MTSSISSSPVFQFQGLASGLDTQSIIDATMAAYKKPLTALEGRRDELDFQRTQFRALNDQLFALQQVSLALRLESTFRSKLVASSDEAVVTATATADAARGTHTVKVNSIAQAASAFGDLTTTYRRTDLTSTAGVSMAGGETHDTTAGTHTVQFTSGRAGRVVGWATGVELDRTLGSYGITNATGFAIRTQGSTYAVSDLTADSTVRDLVQAINTGGSRAIAEVRDGRLAITGSTGGTDFAIVDSNGNYTDSIAAKLLGASGERITAASIVGTRSVTAGQTLSSLGVSSANSLRIVVGAEDQTVTIAVGSTVQQLCDQINTQFAGVDAAVVGGRVVLSATRVGQGFEVIGTDYATDVVAQVFGLGARQSTQGQAVNASASVTGASSGARIVGGVTVQSNDPLSAYGVTQTNGMKIIAEDGSTLTLSGLTTSSTVGDVVAAINAGSSSVRAQVIGGRLVLSSADGGRNFTIQDVDETQNGLASRLLGLASPGASTMIQQSTAGTLWANAGATPSLQDASDGANGAILGQRPLTGDVVLGNTLDSYGVTVFGGFTVTVDRVSTTLTMASGQTVADLVAALDAVNGVRASVYDGRLLVEAEDGNSDVTLSDSDYTDGIAPRLMGITAERASTAEITGAVSGLTGAETLTSLGIDSSDGFSLNVAGTSKTITGLTGTSTVTDLIAAINSQVTTVSASLTADGRLSIRALEPHVNFVLSDSDYRRTIAGEALGLRASQATLEPAKFNGQVVGAATGAAVVGPDLSASGGLTSALSAFGITTTNGQFVITVRGAEQTVEFASTDTLGTLLGRIDALVGIRADFVAGRVVLGAEDPREDFTVESGLTSYATGMGFRELLGTSASLTTSGRSSSTNRVTAASTGDYTAADLVLPTQGGNPEFHAQVGSEGFILSDLYLGGLLQGTGANSSFKTGTAYLYTSAELTTGVDTPATVRSSAPVGQRSSFALTEVDSPTATASSLVGNAVFEEAVAGTYSVVFVTGGYVIQDASGNALGEAVADGATFTAYADSALAGSSLTFTSTGSPAPATDDQWSFTLGLDLTKSLASAGFATAATTATNGTFSINGKQITITDYSTETVESVLAKINGSGAGVLATYDRQADQFLLSSTTLGGDATITMGALGDSSNFLTIARMDLGTGGGTLTSGSSNDGVTTDVRLSSAGLSTSVTAGTFSINDVKLYVDPASDTLEDIIARINDSAARVRASYDSVNDRLVLETDSDDPQTTTNTLRVRVGGTTDTSNFLVAMRLASSSEAGASRQVGKAGTDAQVVVDGVSYTRVTNSVDNILTGVTLNFTGASDKTASISISVDEDRALEALSKWVAEWNKAVVTLNPDQLTKTQKKYLTELTDDERANMTFSEIDDYEALNEAYRTQELFRTDPTSRRLFYQLRTAATDPVRGLDESYNALDDLGIETYTTLGQIVTKGHLVLDSTDAEEILAKLKDNSSLVNAIRYNEEDVLALFAAKSYAGSGASVTAGATVSTSGLQMPAGGEALQFRVGDGRRNSAVVSLQPGVLYTREQLLELLDNAGLNIGDDDQLTDLVGVRASITQQGALTFAATSSETDANVWFEDLSTGANTLETILRIFVPQTGDGIGEYFNSTLAAAMKSDGVLGIRTKAGGSFDSQISELDDRITDWETRAALKEQQLQDTYTRLETTLSQLQSKQTAINQLAASLPSTSSSSS